MSKLFIVSRDGKSVNDFLSLNNLSKSDIKMVKTVSDLKSAVEGDRFVIVNPKPFAYYWSIRLILYDKKLKNVTKKYKSI